MNESARLASELVCRPWLLPASVHRSLCESVAERAAPAVLGVGTQGPRPGFSIVDRVAVIPVVGVLARYDSEWTTDVTEIRRQVAVAAADAEIDAIVLVFDSPGGSAMGIPEAARAIAAARASKPVLAYVDGFCDSGAYWLASQATAIYATESADVGCIGCYLAVLDQSRAAEMVGLKVELFKSGRFKGMGVPGTSLTDEQRVMLQTNVDRIADEFKAAVRTGRSPNVGEDVMQGQSFSAAAAVAVGLVDQVADYEQAMRDAALLVKFAQRRTVV